MIELIGQLKQLAADVAADSRMPAQAAEVQDHARAFESGLAVQLEGVVSRIQQFCANYRERKPALDQLVARLQDGDAPAKAQINAELAALYGELSGVATAGDGASRKLGEYRTQVQEDERRLQELQAEMSRRLAAQNRAVANKRRELRDLVNKLKNPLYAFGEVLTRLLTNKRSLQREIGDLQRDIVKLQHEARDAGYGVGAIQQLGHSLDLVADLTQNLFNALDVAAGRMSQVAGTIERTETRHLAVLMEAYLLTLAEQVRSLEVESD
jgi:chromosome segregation ATPase